MPKNIIWLYGRSGAGKTTLGKLLRDFIEERGYIVCLIDGDYMRKSINKGLGFSKKDRHFAATRIFNTAFSLNSDYVIVCMITPLIKTREWLSNKGVNLVYIHSSLGECIRRDNKGLYRNKTEGICLFETGITKPDEFVINNNNYIDDSFDSLKAYWRLESVI